MVGYGGGELELKRCVREAYGGDAQQCGGDGRLRHVRRMSKRRGLRKIIRLVEISSEDDRSSTMVNGDGSREAFLSVIEMNGDG
ncbi:hypothetical protein Bca101_072490 [Brassica carinata]